MSDDPLRRVTTANEAKTLYEAERANVPFVQWRDAEGVLRVFMLPAERSRVTIGRAGDSDLPLDWDAEVSRTHAVLESVGGRWMLVDDGLSRNGSFVNGSRIRSRRRLRSGDRLCFGSTHVAYFEPPDDPDPTRRTVDDEASVALSLTQRKVLIALCRPLIREPSAAPATDEQIGNEVLLGVEAVAEHLRLLFERFGLDELPDIEKRARLAVSALKTGVLAPHEL